jgi:hypothetical protein
MARADQGLRLGGTLPLGESQCGELSKMKIKVIPSGALSHISIEPTLRD